MVNDNITKAPLQIMYLSVSVFCSFCAFNNCYVLQCCNIIGIMCLIDLYFIKNKDMIFHHILALCMINYTHINNNEYTNALISIMLKTEISTIFLTTNNLLNCRTNYFKNINKILFVLTFMYYRIYNYAYYLILNKNTYTIFFIYSKNKFEFCKVYISIYGLFMLNLYWFYLILKKTLFQNWRKSIKG